MLKGCRSGTVVLDPDRHRVIDLLPDRTVATRAGWPKRRRGITIVARDRTTGHARGARRGDPLALQVTGRWHIPADLRQAVERLAPWRSGAGGA